MPKAIGSDNGPPAFVAQVSQGVAKSLEVKWKLHCVYRPQSSGQKERMNRTLKETLTKLTMETGADLVLLPLALFRTENTPSWFSLTLFEILYDVFEPILCCNNDLYANAKLKGLQVVQKEVWSQLATANEPGTPKTSHQFQVGDLIYMHLHHAQTPKPRWKGPCLVLFTNSSYSVFVLNLWPMYP